MSEEPRIAVSDSSLVVDGSIESTMFESISKRIIQFVVEKSPALHIVGGSDLVRKTEDEFIKIIADGLIKDFGKEKAIRIAQQICANITRFCNHDTPKAVVMYCSLVAAQVLAKVRSGGMSVMYFNFS